MSYIVQVIFKSDTKEFVVVKCATEGDAEREVEKAFRKYGKDIERINVGKVM